MHSEDSEGRRRPDRPATILVVDDERPIRMMIAVERRPVSEHWVAECAEQGIVLVWPEGFAAGVNS